MKARVKNITSPKILAANIKEENSSKIRYLAEKYSAEYITVDNLQKSVAVLLKEKSSDSPDNGKYEDSDAECLLFAGFERSALNKLLNDFKNESVIIPLKAMYTPYNREWSFAHLIHELEEENRRMTGGGKQ
jgi:hypothetical protein